MRSLHLIAALLILVVFKTTWSVSLSALYLPRSYKCDRQLQEDARGNESSDLLLASSLCLRSQTDTNCIGVKCKNSTLDCEKIPRPTDFVRCIDDLRDPNATLWLKSEYLKAQPELGLIDLEVGQLVSASVRNVSSFAIQPSQTTRMQAQIPNGILVCMETSTVCNVWTEGTNEWTSISSLNHIHGQGTLNLLGDLPIVIGGMNQDLGNHGIVEMLDPITRQWVLGPPLDPGRRAHATVVINQTSLVVVGGYDEPPIQSMGSVKILSMTDKSWQALDELPIGVYNPVCGLLNQSFVLCIGGRDAAQFRNTANGLDLSSNNALWQRLSMFDTENPIIIGFLFQLRHELFCMSIKTESFRDVRQLLRMNLTDEDPEWELLEMFSENEFNNVGRYMMNGHLIEP